MLLGTFLLLNNMGFFIPQAYHIIISWQMLFIAIGIILIFDKTSDRKNIGIIIMGIGMLLLLPKIFPVSVSGVILPVFIICVGIGFVVKATMRKTEDESFFENTNWTEFKNDYAKNSTKNNGGLIKNEYVFTGAKEKWTEGKLRNVEIDAVFSGVELDFSQAELADDIDVPVHIKITSVFSGVILYVPENWNLMIRKTGVFGGFVDKRPNRVSVESYDRIVILEAEAVFGGGEIRCYE